MILPSLRPINESTFKAVDPFRCIISHEHPRRFALLSLGERNEVALSWRSDMIEPTIETCPDSGISWIGVDERIVAIKERNGGVLFSLRLPSNFIGVRRLGDVTVVLCETEVFVINSDLSIRRSEGLREIPESCEREGNTLVVTFIDGEVDRIQI